MRSLYQNYQSRASKSAVQAEVVEKRDDAICWSGVAFELSQQES
jgi:hypothetical protein